MPIQADKTAVEKSTFAAVVTLTDEDDVAVPDNDITSITWSLSNSAGTIINSRTDVSIVTPGNNETIVLSGDDLQLLDSGNDYEERHLEVSAVIDTTLGSDLPVKESLIFKVLNLNTIT